MKYLLLCCTIVCSSCGFRSIPQSKNEVEAKFAEVQNQYKRRSDLIPNLVKVVKSYAAHEKETLTAVVEARAKATAINIDPSKLNAQNIQQFQKAQGGLSSALSKLMVVIEKYPNLKANQNFRDLQAQLEGTENRITVARNRYIESIKNFNNLVTVPPESFTNSLFYKHEKMPQFQVENLNQMQDAPKIDM
jgi:LemA protein